ncbi:MAG: putative dsRNA-binding protein, partial [Chloroflexi bacterium]|nr:putative dsRNA-binding protein [Chloroflexota bacterium]
GGLHRVSVLACTLEALIGAVFLDKGYIIARNYALVLLKNDLRQAFSGLQNADYKSLLQELTQARFKVTPVYRTISTKGKEHDKEFSVAVYLGEMIIGKGNGKSKQASEKEAARAALEFLNKEPNPV